MRIEVIEQIDKHSREVWEFNTFDFNAVLVGFRKEEKPPKKRVWRITAKYDRYDKRGSSLKKPEKLPNWVKIEAVEKLKGFIKVMMWDDRHR